MSNGYRKLQRIWIVSLMINLTAVRASTDPPMAGCEWVKPITQVDNDVLTRETKRALLRYSETWSEICK